MHDVSDRSGVLGAPLQIFMLALNCPRVHSRVAVSVALVTKALLPVVQNLNVVQ